MALFEKFYRENVTNEKQICFKRLCIISVRVFCFCFIQCLEILMKNASVLIREVSLSRVNAWNIN